MVVAPREKQTLVPKLMDNLICSNNAWSVLLSGLQHIFKIRNCTGMTKLTIKNQQFSH